MIYACIKFIQEWASPLTVINYTLFGMASGFSIAAVFAHYQAENLVKLFVGWAIIFTLLATIMRLISLVRNAKLKPKSTLQSAIGVRHDKIKQMSMGAMGGSYNTREYFHGKSAIFLKSIKWIFILMVFAVPLFLLSSAMINDDYELLFICAISQYIGLIAERWFFFAQANHPQNIYYQTV